MGSALPEVAVTGVTGAVGGEVARILAAQGVPLRLLARRPERAPSLDGCVALPCSYADAGVRAHLEGVSVLLMVSASESADRLEEHRTFVTSAAQAGVEHVVYTSFLAAAPDATFTLGRDHFATEQMIRGSGMRHTFLRDNFYLDILPMLAGRDGVIRGPAGEGRLSAVARLDVARCAAAVLGDPAPHVDRTYDLTGREAVTLAEAAEVIAEHQGRPVTFHDETVEEAHESRRGYGAPDWQLDAWVSTYTAIASGELAVVSPHVEELTGAPPLTLAELLSGGHAR
jgi:NAD(P)H dehydrogenase (quinone)